MAELDSLSINGVGYDIRDNGAYRKPNGGIPKTDLATEVQSSLTKADETDEKIPSQASSSNQLADKAFVNSSIATATATHRGTYNLVTDLSLSVSATQGQIATALATKMSALGITPDNNDYVFVLIPTADATPTEIARIDRYKYNGTAWSFEYSLNNSGFTAAQWAAINSGITSNDKTKLDALPTSAELTILLNGKESTSNKVTSITDESTDAQYGSAKAVWTLVTSFVNTLREWAESIFAKTTGDYPKMSVGSSKRLENEQPITGSFFMRTTANDGDVENGDEEIANGLVKILEVKGNSVKYNQLADINTAYEYSATIERIQGTNFWNVTTNGNNQGIRWNVGAAIAGHKYLVKFDVETTENVTLRIFNYDGGSDGSNVTVNGRKSVSMIMTQITTKSDQRFGIQTRSDGYNGTFKVGNPTTIDLTALGIDNLTTVAQVEAWLKENWGESEYYAYSAGKVVNVNMTGIESTNRNLLDANGNAELIGNYDIGGTYGSYYDICGSYDSVSFVDKKGNTVALDIDEEGKFEVTVDGTLTVLNPSADCAVFLWWDGSKTDYVEHKVSTGRLDVSHIYGKKNGQGELVRVWPTGIPAIGNLKDILTTEDGVPVAKRVLGEVNMGLQDITTENHYDEGKDWLISAPNAKPATSVSEVSNVICALYQTRDNSYVHYSEVNAICTDMEAGKLMLHDTSYNQESDLSSITTKLTGVMAYYELETPETYTDLVYQGSNYFEDGTPVILPTTYEADNWGIEAILPKNTSDVVTAMPTVTNQYSIDTIETIKTLNDVTEHLEKEKVSKSDLPTVTVGKADNLTGEPIPVTTGYTLKPTGYDPSQTELEFADGIVNMTEIQGRAVAWNQMVNISTVQNALGLTVTKIDKCRIKCNGTSTGTDKIVATSSLPLIPQGHKGYFAARILSGTINGDTNIYDGFSTRHVKIGESKIFKATSNQTSTMYMEASSGVEFNNAEIAITLIDITILNSTIAAKANLTVAEVEAYLASIRTPKPFYAQNAGTLLGAKMLGWQLRKTANLLNPTTKQAKLVEYNYVPNSNKYELSGFFGNIANAALQFTPYATGVAMTIDYHGDPDIPLIDDKYFTIPSEGVFEIIEATEGTAITGDMTRVCVKAVWDDSKQGEIVAYAEDNIVIDSANIYYDNEGVKTQVFDGGILRSTGDGSSDVHDRVYFDEIAKKWKSANNVGNREYASGDESDATVITDKTNTWYALTTPITHDTLYYKVGDEYLPMEEVFPNGIQGYCCNWASENLVEQGDDANGQPQSITPTTTEVFQSDYKELLKTIGDTYISKEQAKGSFENLAAVLNDALAEELGGMLVVGDFNNEGEVTFTLETT